MSLIGKLVKLRWAVVSKGGREFAKGERFRVSSMKHSKLTLAACSVNDQNEVVYLHAVPPGDIEVEPQQPPEQVAAT